MLDLIAACAFSSGRNSGGHLGAPGDARRRARKTRSCAPLRISDLLLTRRGQLNEAAIAMDANPYRTAICLAVRCSAAVARVNRGESRPLHAPSLRTANAVANRLPDRLESVLSEPARNAPLRALR